MTEAFGKKLRNLRVNSEVGLRELARLINKPPGYLSDVEHDHVPPPSEDITTLPETYISQYIASWLIFGFLLRNHHQAESSIVID